MNFPARLLLRSISGAAAVAFLLLPPRSLAATTVEGEFALVGVTQQVAGELIATPAGSPTDLKLDISFHRVHEKNALKRYDVELTKQMHVIAVSDDFKVFLHHHVTHVIDGHGQDRMRFPRPGLYHIFVDAAPKTIGQQVMRFDLTVGDEPSTPLISRQFGAPVTEAESGLYTLRFDTLELDAGKPTTLAVHISEHGKPARDLHPFLGVGAHVVLIDAETLDYIHVHPVADGDMAMHDGPSPAPMADDQAASPADLMFHVTAPKSGAYQLWLQFIGGRTIYTVPFVVLVK
jgi:hypothetical protein